MAESNITRNYLETLSFSELVAIADEYGVDVPEDLDHRFLIAEILELVNEEHDEDDEMTISSETDEEKKSVFSGNYNETQICMILRNPAWLFVYWNLNEQDKMKISKIPGCVLKVRVCSMEDEENPVPLDSFEVQLASKTQEQYILLPGNIEFLKVELVYSSLTQKEVLAFSEIIKVPQGCDEIFDYEPGKDFALSPIEALSGKEVLIKDHFKNHRHSFS
ncbi:MAG: DUF4912 domain-containing protein [Treponema sp.]|nr:DUF4912 domain-containing protein [Treponema sp.]